MSNQRSCYYPDGSLSKTNGGDIPCGNGDGVACCPPQWQCQDNGLCYNSGVGYYGRYTCTDRSWKSDGCPQICTHDNTASGNEAILECSSNSWCCDANRPEPGCCKTSSSRFSLDSSKKQKPIGGGGSNSDSVVSSSGSTSTSSPSSSTSSPATPSITVITSIATSNNANGAPQTIYITSSVTSTSSPSSSSSHKSLAPIIAPAVLIPLFLILGGALLFVLLRRRRRRRQHAHAGGPTGDGAVPMYKEEVSPMSPYTGSELEGSSPDLTAAGAPVGGRAGNGGQHRWETPSDVGNSSPSTLSPGMKRESKLSPLSQVFDGREEGAAVELPAEEKGSQVGLGIQDKDKEQKRISELGTGQLEEATRLHEKGKEEKRASERSELEAK